jgi:hypothetical protein
LIVALTAGIMRRFKQLLQWNLVRVIIILGLFAENVIQFIKDQEYRSFSHGPGTILPSPRQLIRGLDVQLGQGKLDAKSYATIKKNGEGSKAS